MAGMAKDTGRVEENTRGTLHQLRDGLQPQVNQFLPELANIRGLMQQMITYGVGVFNQPGDGGIRLAGATAGNTFNITGTFIGYRDLDDLVEEIARRLRAKGA